MNLHSPITSPEMMSKRLVYFGVSVIALSRMALRFSATRVIANQLMRCATSVGANYEEAQAAESWDDFIHKLQISLKEIRESCYWLELLCLIPSSLQKEAEKLYDEAIQLRAILSKAVSSSKKNSPNHNP